MTKLFFTRTAVLASLFAAGFLCAQNLATFRAPPAGSKVRLDGTSTFHDWWAESPLVAGTIELDAILVNDPTKAAPGKVNAKVQANVPALQLRSSKGKAMDDVMHAALKASQHRQIQYRLTELVLKEAPKSAEAPMQFDSKGELSIAGVTNQVAFPVTITRLEKDKLKIQGSTTVKMSSYGVKPQAPTLSFGLVKAGDDVKVTFDWLTTKTEATAAK